MKTNVGRVDRSVRLAVAAVFAVLLVAGVVKGTLAIVLAIVAAYFVITTFAGFCPSYVPFGLSTKGKDKGDDSCEV